MMVLRKVESDVLELLREGKSQRNIAQILRKNRGTVISIVARLSELSVIENTAHGRYQIMIDKYETTDRNHGGMKRGKSAKVEIPEQTELYIREHYGKVPRGRIARSLNLDKVSLNLMILQLGLGGVNRNGRLD